MISLETGCWNCWSRSQEPMLF